MIRSSSFLGWSNQENFRKSGINSRPSLYFDLEWSEASIVLQLFVNATQWRILAAKKLSSIFLGLLIKKDQSLIPCYKCLWTSQWMRHYLNLFSEIRSCKFCTARLYVILWMVAYCRKAGIRCYYLKIAQFLLY